MQERWYKHGLIYEVSVRSFLDSDGDGVGDLPGLTAKLDYLATLGVTCLWLLPFQPSPWRDDGYDITDFYGVHPDFGNLGDFVQLVQRAADRGIRVIIDLVLNHTSDEHPWFRAARAGDRRFRDYYVWADRRPPDADKGIVFPGVQKTTWSYDRAARRYYFHRFYDFQPDLNIANPDVRDEMAKIVEFWAQLGISGFRMDAVPFLIEPVTPSDTHPGPSFEFLHELRNRLSWRRGDAVLLGEANVERDAIADYYTVGGMHMLFNFPANQHLWLSLATHDARPLVRALEETAGIPQADQWANFLRNHDEIDLGRLSERERTETFAAFGPRRDMQLFGRGLRRRMAPMLGGDRRRIELAFSLLLTLPGTPVLYAGDELGMGEDLSLPERQPVRTAMQWSRQPNGGFSSAARSGLKVPVVSRGPFSVEAVNAVDEEGDPGSLLRWLRGAIRVRTECPEFGTGAWRVLGSRDPSVLAMRFTEGHGAVLAIHNLAAEPRRAALRLPRDERSSLRELFSDGSYDDTGASFELGGYGYRWFRVR